MTTQVQHRSVLLVGPRPASGSLAADLEADRFEVMLAANPAEVRGVLRTTCPSAVIVDLDMPASGGLEAVGLVRGGGPEDPWDASIPVLGMSGSSEPHRVVRALERGADEVVGTPYAYVELLARLRALIRRADGEWSAGFTRVGPLVVDRRGRRATIDGHAVALSAKELGLLAALARDPRRVVSKHELLRDVWGYKSPGRTRTVDSHASRLRRKLADASGGQRYIINVWGLGYRLLSDDS
ncbi:MAG: response regulator transcription factor [Thermoleophilia bacterium]|nr:response regulator transcription factor [Thermoleophilia bacterium]